MEFFEELLLTALVSVLLAFLLGKIAADRPGAAPLAADLGPRLRVGLDPIQEEEETDKSSGDACGSRTGAGERDRSEIRIVGVEEERLREERLEEVSGFDLQKSSSDVDVPRAEELSGKKEDDEVEIGRIDDHLVKQEGRLVTDKTVDEVVELRGEDEVEVEDARKVDGEMGGSLLHGEDEWEGIERSELEKLFGVATKFVGGKRGGDAVSKLSNEVQMQLYGLHKVAIEGPCHAPQPMALKVSARAKWHAWQRLGNMNPEAAMEQYISLLTEGIPEWMAEKSGEEAKGHHGNDPPVVEVSGTGQLNSETSHCISETEILVEDSSSVEGVTDNVDTGPKLFKQGLTKIFLFNLLSPTRVTF